MKEKYKAEQTSMANSENSNDRSQNRERTQEDGLVSDQAVAQKVLPEPENKKKLYRDREEFKETKVKIQVPKFQREQEFSSPLLKSRQLKKNAKEAIKLFKIESAGEGED